MASKELIQAVAATAELCGARLSDAAARMLVADLEQYPEQHVLAALTRVRRKGKRFSLGSVLEEIDAQDGRPGADTAWSMLPRSEAQTVVWTAEMAQAWGVALPLMEAGDKFGAQRAFKEEYTRLCDAAREQGIAPAWTVALGHDPAGRAQPVQEAIALGRLSQNITQVLRLEQAATPIAALPAPTRASQSKGMRALANARAMLASKVLRDATGKQ
jgi:hypothetical protein